MEETYVARDLPSNDFVGGLSVEVITRCVEGHTDLDLRRMFSRRRIKKRFWTPDFPINQVALRAFLIARSTDRHLAEFEEVGDTPEGASLDANYLRKYMSRPTFDIVETCGALQAGLFTEDDIAQIYFRIINQPFRRGEYNWSVHSLERPIHIFTREGLADVICETIDDVGTEDEHPAFTFYANLEDRVAFANLTRTLLEQDVCREAFARILRQGEVFSEWQYRSVADVGNAFVQKRRV
ncbi:MAG: hypothetical protein RIQ72_16 [Candidatus Parcubacteria bacterium]|jgi:hypothetical protein